MGVLVAWATAVEAIASAGRLFRTEGIGVSSAKAEPHRTKPGQTSQHLDLVSRMVRISVYRVGRVDVHDKVCRSNGRDSRRTVVV